MTLVAMRLATAVDGPLMKLTKGRARLSFIVPMLLLQHVGAKSAQVRQTPLLYVADGDDLLVIASNGGQVKAPGWCFNLQAHPAVKVLHNGDWRDCVAVELQGDERQRAWEKTLNLYPNYQRYAQRSQRQIPVFRLQAPSAGA